MNVSYEFSKVKDSFNKVKGDMKTISSKINHNYDDFLHKHEKLSKEIADLSHSVINTLNEFRSEHLNQLSGKTAITKEILDAKESIDELKKEVSKIQLHNHDLNEMISLLKKTGSDLTQIKKKTQSNDLEIFLLKERLLEKDVEIKQIKDVSKHMLQVMDELSRMEIEILNKTN